MNSSYLCPFSGFISNIPVHTVHFHFTRESRGERQILPIQTCSSSPPCSPSLSARRSSPSLAGSRKVRAGNTPCPFPAQGSASTTPNLVSSVRTSRSQATSPLCLTIMTNAAVTAGQAARPMAQDIRSTAPALATAMRESSPARLIASTRGAAASTSLERDGMPGAAAASEDRTCCSGQHISLC